MAHTGFLKSQHKPLIVRGFLYGFICAACLILCLWWFEGSIYSVANATVANLKRLLWNVIITPAAIIVPFFGVELQIHPDLASARDLVFIIIADGIVFGMVGAFIGWRIAELRFKALHPQLSESERLLSKGVPPRRVNRRLILHRSAWGLCVGFFGTHLLWLLSLILGFPLGLVTVAAIYLPTHFLFGLFGHDWPPSGSDLSQGALWLILFGVSLINGALMGITFGLVTALIKVSLLATDSDEKQKAYEAKK